jgi:hypothetical protein
VRISETGLWLAGFARLSEAERRLAASANIFTAENAEDAETPGRADDAPPPNGRPTTDPFIR